MCNTYTIQISSAFEALSFMLVIICLLKYILSMVTKYYSFYPSDTCNLSHYVTVQSTYCSPYYIDAIMYIYYRNESYSCVTLYNYFFTESKSCVWFLKIISDVFCVTKNKYYCTEPNSCVWFLKIPSDVFYMYNMFNSHVFLNG